MHLGVGEKKKEAEYMSVSPVLGVVRKNRRKRGDSLIKYPIINRIKGKINGKNFNGVLYSLEACLETNDEEIHVTISIGKQQALHGH